MTTDGDANAWPDLDDLGPDGTDPSPPVGPSGHVLDEAVVTALYRAAATVSTCAGEQTLLVVWCTAAGRGPDWLAAKGKARAERRAGAYRMAGLPVPKVIDPGELGVLDLSAAELGFTR